MPRVLVNQSRGINHWHSRLTRLREGSGCSSCYFGVLLASRRFGLVHYPGILRRRGQGSMCVVHSRRRCRNHFWLFIFLRGAVEVSSCCSTEGGTVKVRVFSSVNLTRSTSVEWSRSPIGGTQTNALLDVGCNGVAPRQRDLTIAPRQEIQHQPVLPEGVW